MHCRWRRRADRWPDGGGVVGERSGRYAEVDRWPGSGGGRFAASSTAVGRSFCLRQSWTRQNKIAVVGSAWILVGVQALGAGPLSLAHGRRNDRHDRADIVARRRRSTRVAISAR